MKRLLLIIPILFSSACSSSTYISECLNKENNYINKDLIEAYNKENTVYIDSDLKTACILSRNCHSITTNDRWKNIQIYLAPVYGAFPKEAGLYSISRDYSFKNCIDKYTDNGSNIFTSDDKNFCISAKKINEPTSNVIFKTRQIKYQEGLNNVVVVKINIMLDDKKFIENNSVTENKPRSQSICETNDLTGKIIDKDF